MTIIQLILSREERSGKQELTAQTAARTLAGYGSISLSYAFIEAIKKGIHLQNQSKKD